MKTFRSIESIRNEAAFRSREDEKRGAFLRELDASEFSVDDWEAQFLNSFLDFTSNRPGDEPRWWTEGRRRSADRMMMKYGGEHPTSNLQPPTSTLSALDLPAPPGTCGYFVRDDDRRQRRCGQPATATIRAGLQLCAEHHHFVTQQAAKLRDWKARQLR